MRGSSSDFNQINNHRRGRRGRRGTTNCFASASSASSAVQLVSTMKTFKNFIGGKWVEPSSGEFFENRNPANWDDVIGKFPLSNAQDVDCAVQSAQRGFEIWRATPAPARGDVLR